MSKEFYIPEISQLAKQSGTNKQGKSVEGLDRNHANEIIEIFQQSCADARKKYSHLLDDLSLTRELSRVILPLGVYTEMYWKIDLCNLMHFLKLRADSHAQYEIRCYADVIMEILKKWLPITYEAFVNYQKEATSLSKKGIELLKRMLNGDHVTAEESGLSKSEWLEFSATFGE
jgi:thymidylate synthase (FAD)